MADPAPRAMSLRGASFARSAGPVAAMLVLLLLLWLVSTHFLSGAFWKALAALAVISVPLALYALYEAAIAKTLRRERYLREGLFFRLFSGRLLIGAVALVLVLLAAPFLLVRLHMLPAREWLLLVLSVPLQLASFSLCKRLLRNEYKPWLLVPAALDWTRIVCPTLLALAYAALLSWRHAPSAGLDLTAAVEAALRGVADVDASRALATLANFFALFEGTKTYFLAHVAAESGRLVFWAAVLDFWMLCYFLSRVLSVALLPRAEWRRVFGPLSDDREAAALTPRRIAVACALFTFVSLFIAVPLLSSVETQVRARPEFEQAFAGTRLRVERIGDEYFAQGTIAALERARRVALARLEVSTGELQQKTDAAFAAMAGNVDVYLDWYYSLGAEYARIGHLLTGDLEDYMARKFAETLAQEDVLRGVESALATSLANSAEANRLYERLVTNLLAQNRLDAPTDEVEVVQTLALSDVLVPPEHAELLGVQSRLLASSGGAVAGVLAGAIAGKLVAKVVTKSSFKLATKAVAKLVASKAAGTTMGAGAGAAAGGAIGSVVPGLGTAIGALIGGVLGGLVVGVGIDAALIEFEEAVGREAFRAELLQALDEARREYLGAAP